MLHLILPAGLHRQAYRVAFALRKRWLRWARRPVEGCTMIARDHEGRVLLVRHSYGSGMWSLPGGGLNRGEEPEAAAIREFREELGAGVTGLRYCGTLEETYHGARNTAHVFTGLIAGQPKPDMREIVEARFFVPDALPADTFGSVRVRLAMLERGLEQR